MVKLKYFLSKLLRPASGEHEPDKVLIFLIGILLIFGLIMLSGVSAVSAYMRSGDSYFYLKRQLVGISFGLIAFWIFSKISYHNWKKWALWFLFFSLFLLILVFIPGIGTSYGKAERWINIFGYSLQPSEFVKISFLLYLAAWLESRGRKLSDFYQGTGPFLIVLSLICVLMIMQPDLGTLCVITATSLIAYFVGGGKKSHIAIIILIGVIMVFAMTQVKPYMEHRFKCMLDRSFSRDDICYQVNQSLIAVGSGGWFGRGLGQSRQKFLYLPEVSGDSIFAIIGEEIGFIFSSLLIGLYFIIFYRGYLIAKKAPDVFGQILAIGIASWIVIQALVNIGGMTTLIPMTGLPLPLISYGSSSILATMIALGILVNISKKTKIR